MAKYKIKYSPKFWPRLNELLLYLKNNWSDKIANEFLYILEEKIVLLNKNPNLGRRSSKYKEIRSISITKHNRLYYRVKKDTILIASLFDTRQNPSKNKFE